MTLEEVMEVKGKGLGLTAGSAPPITTPIKEEIATGEEVSQGDSVVFLATWDQEESTSPRKVSAQLYNS